MIPIYGKNNNGRGYTIYLDIDSMRAYRSDNQEVNQTKYWIGYFVTIIFLSVLTEISLPNTLLVKSSLVIVGVPISIFTGRIIYRKAVNNVREIFPTKDMLEDYIAEGKSLMKKELILVGIILTFSLMLCFSFLVINSFILLILAFIGFTIFGMLSCNMSIKRWKLYKYGLSETGT